MKKTMESAYTDMMTNLAKSTSAIPLHLQPATGALAWWESSDSLLAKSQIDDTDELKKSSAENESEEAYEEDEQHSDPREESNAENDVHGGDGSEGEGDDEAEEGEEDESEMEKSLGALGALASSMLARVKKKAGAAENAEPAKAEPSATTPEKPRMGALERIRVENERKAALVNEAAGIVRGMNETFRTKVLGKAMAELDTLSTSMLAKAKDQMDMFDGAQSTSANYHGPEHVEWHKLAAQNKAPGPFPGSNIMYQSSKAEFEGPKKVKPKMVDGSKRPEPEDPYDPANRATLSWRGEHPVKGGGVDLGKALAELDAVADQVLEKSMTISPIAASRGVTSLSRKLMLQKKYPHITGDAAREEMDRADDQGVVTPAMPKPVNLIKT
jgi:hypothetical protein